MNIIQCFQMAIKSIKSSKGRSFLTMLGIIIGIVAVIVIVGLGNGMEVYMTESFQSMGTNLLTVNIMGRGSSRSVSVDNMYAVVDDNPEYFSGMSPTVSLSGSIKVGTDTLDYTTVSGVSEDYKEMRGFTLDSGRFLQYVDIFNREKVCVVGSYISTEWFNGDAIGNTVRINGNPYKVIGVLSESADNEEGSTDDYIYVPYTTAAKLSGTGTISSYTFAMVSEEKVSESKELIETALYETFGSENAYRITSMSEILDTMTSMINVMVVILAAIAAISLVVGGVGIMNIMLVSVSERTREIGIRKALGAKRRHVLMQFVIEAGTTSTIGGILGIIIGYLLSFLATKVIVLVLEVDMAVSPTTGSVLLAFGISAGIGILFGYLPARKAAYLNPIDALRL